MRIKFVHSVFIGLIVGGVLGYLTISEDSVVRQSQDFPPSKEILNEVIARTLADTQISKYYEMCPADAYKAARPFWQFRRKDAELYSTCKSDPLYCFDACTNDKMAGACFSLARVQQDYYDSYDNGEPTKGYDVYARIFSYACALGSAGGCTNRGASIRNVGLSFDGNTLRNNGHDTQACLLRTFEQACADGDAWGCTMYGQAIQLGEGTKMDSKKAKIYYDKSCTINPDFEACTYAKDMQKKDSLDDGGD